MSNSNFIGDFRNRPVFTREMLALAGSQLEEYRRSRSQADRYLLDIHGKKILKKASKDSLKYLNEQLAHTPNMRVD